MNANTVVKQDRETVIAQLKERLLNAVGKYSDYSRYAMDISNVQDQYEETFELYNSEIWLGNSTGTIREQAQEMLRVTTNLFLDLQDNAQRELFYVMSEIVDLDEIDQKEIYGIAIEKEHFTEDELGEMLLGWFDYEYAQENALSAYLKRLKTFYKIV